MSQVRTTVRTFFFRPFLDCLDGLGHILLRPNSLRCTLLMCAALIACWFLYVPVHELLHVLGCVVTGGTVTELQLDAKYGGRILSGLFPFVTSHSDYAGRLSGFDTHGSDFCYFITVFLPFLLTVFPGVLLIMASRRKYRPILFGAGIVVGLAPIGQIPNDYLEMGSILTTRMAGWLTGAGSAVFPELRSDDLFRLIREMFQDRASKGMTTWAMTAAGILIVIASQALGIVLAFATYAWGRWVSIVLFGDKKNPPA